MKAAVLTIGNEVSSGQIVNSNAAWVSQELEHLKIEVMSHLTVQDDHRQILDAINFLTPHVEILMITGGLGPTRDDLTRHSVCAWLEDELTFDEESWQRIVARLTEFGVPVVESNRQQCYFPKSSRIISNAAGTANAFYAFKNGVHVWCLPGPPREIKTIWRDHIGDQLAQDIAQGVQGLSLFRWHCLGQSESALGEIVEEAIAGSTLTSGYRPHIPYVEVKIWSPDQDLGINKIYLERLEAAIRPWLISKDDNDIASKLVTEILPEYPAVKVFDLGSFGVLAERMGRATQEGQGPHFSILSQCQEDREFANETVLKTLELADPEVLTLSLGALNSNGAWTVGVAFDGFMKTTVLESPFKPGKRLDRFRKLQVEKTIFTWTQLLQDIKG